MKHDSMIGDRHTQRAEKVRARPCIGMRSYAACPPYAQALQKGARYCGRSRIDASFREFMCHHCCYQFAHPYPFARVTTTFTIARHTCSQASRRVDGTSCSNTPLGIWAASYEEMFIGIAYSYHEKKHVLSGRVACWS